MNITKTIKEKRMSHQTRNTLYRMVCDLDAELSLIVDGGDAFLLAIMATRKALKSLKRFL